MTKITFIGAGSLGFTRGLVRDLLTFPLLRDATICLMDINSERLEFARASIQRIVDMGKYPAKVEATLDRVEARIRINRIVARTSIDKVRPGARIDDIFTDAASVNDVQEAR